MKNIIGLSRDEFDLEEDENTILVHDKVVNLVYEYDKQDRGWSFPAGSRVQIMNLLTGIEM